MLWPISVRNNKYNLWNNIRNVRHNINNPAIDKIHILLERDEDKQSWMYNTKVVISNFGKRMTFRNFIEYANSYTEDISDIHVITNFIR